MKDLSHTAAVGKAWKGLNPMTNFLPFLLFLHNESMLCLNV